MRSIGMDVHRSFAQIAIVEDGLCRDEGRIGVKPEDLRAWAETLEPDDEYPSRLVATNAEAFTGSRLHWRMAERVKRRGRASPRAASSSRWTTGHTRGGESGFRLGWIATDDLMRPRKVAT